MIFLADLYWWRIKRRPLKEDKQEEERVLAEEARQAEIQELKDQIAALLSKVDSLNS